MQIYLKVMPRKIVLTVIVVISFVVETGARVCYQCSNMFDPRLCSNQVTCASNQDSCFIEEVTNEHLNFGYHMGCEASTACGMRSAAVPIGRRQVPIAHETFTTCYKCCQEERCNAVFCDELCINNPCFHGGFCTAMRQSSQYTCTCRTGYTGKNCETNIDDCALYPCRNGGTCIDRINGYTCLCPVRFTGSRCENGIASTISVCAQCDGVYSPETCSRLKFCAEGEECYVDGHLIGGRILYNMGCRTQQVCQFYEGLFNQGRRAVRQTPAETICLSCCRADLCNQKSCINPRKLPQVSCAAYLALGLRTSGVYPLDLKDGGPLFDVYCDMTTETGGWIVFQRRLNGSVDFYKDWASYKKGFGDLNEEFYLGNDIIHRLTSLAPRELRVDLGDWNNIRRYAHYNNFSLGDEREYYKLTVTGYSGTAGDSLITQNLKSFSTKDVDHDLNIRLNCATSDTGAWWYGYTSTVCTNSNLNGRYLRAINLTDKGVIWSTWLGHDYSLKFSEMKLR